MKRLHIFSLVVIAALAFTGCKDADYKVTSTGLRYKIIDGGSKDSTKEGDVLKMHVIHKLSGSKDTIINTSYGKLPTYVKVQPLPPGQPLYSPVEVFHLLKKGDSLITVLYVDSLVKKGFATVSKDSVFFNGQYDPILKKGDKITFTFKVLQVFKNDSLAQADYQKEMELDAPRQRKEQEEMMKKMRKEQDETRKKELDSLKKTGDLAKQEAEIANWLKAKNITATKTALGTFVKIDNPGTGAQVADGKFVTVKYTGKKILADSTFESNSFTMPIGQGGSIPGFEDGLKQFKQGGKGTIYIPGYLAYGKNHPPIFTPYEALSFAVEITAVSDKDPSAMPPTGGHAANDGHK